VLQGGLPSAPGPLTPVTDLGGTSNMTWTSTPDWVLQMCYPWCWTYSWLYSTRQAVWTPESLRSWLTRGRLVALDQQYSNAVRTALVIWPTSNGSGLVTWSALIHSVTDSQTTASYEPPLHLNDTHRRLNLSTNAMTAVALHAYVIAATGNEFAPTRRAECKGAAPLRLVLLLLAVAHEPPPAAIVYSTSLLASTTRPG
jgi:hypothetical protein